MGVDALALEKRWVRKEKIRTLWLEGKSFLRLDLFRSYVYSVVYKKVMLRFSAFQVVFVTVSLRFP